MKYYLLFTLASLLFIVCNAQPTRVSVSTALKNKAFPVSRTSPQLFPENLLMSPAGPLSFMEDTIGTTRYDLQTLTGSPSGRFIGFPDGTLSAVWTMGYSGTAYSDRGTGYNYFDGLSWRPIPEQRIETVRTGWPSIARWGENGEIIINHRSGTTPLHMITSVQKGSEIWTESDIPKPEEVSGLLWPRIVTSGTDHQQVHIFALSAPTGNGGLVYKGMNGALLYYRSTDGGNTWADLAVQLPGMDTADFLDFNGDCYAFAEPKGDKLAFVVGSWEHDLFVMTSADEGVSWQKTVIWEHPYPKWDGEEADTLYCPDGALHCAFDANGMLHVVFGITRLYAEDGDWYRFPFVDGIGYWNESMPAWTGGDQLNALDPDLLYNQGALIGWMQDVNNNGSIDLEYENSQLFADYWLGASSFPQLQFDAQNRGLLVYSSLTEGYHYLGYDFRHLWARAFSYDGISLLPFQDLQDDPVLGYRESLFPVLNPYSDPQYWYLIFQQDRFPELGNSIMCYIDCLKVSKLLNEMPEADSPISLSLQPNPCLEQASLQFELTNPGMVQIEIFSIQGDKVFVHPSKTCSKGRHSCTLDVSGLPAGMYMLRLQSGGQVRMVKMMHL